MTGEWRNALDGLHRAKHARRASAAADCAPTKPEANGVPEAWRRAAVRECVTACHASCGVRRLAAAVCRAGLPGRVPRVCRRLGSGEVSLARIQREQAPALHTRYA